MALFRFRFKRARCVSNSSISGMNQLVIIKILSIDTIQGGYTCCIDSFLQAYLINVLLLSSLPSPFYRLQHAVENLVSEPMRIIPTLRFNRGRLNQRRPVKSLPEAT